MDPISMTEVIGGKKYSTDTAQVVAHNCYWDGSNHERGGRNTYLYKTKKGNFFALYLTQWQGEHDRIEPLSKEQAQEYWDDLREKEMSYEEAFGEAPEEA